MIDIDAIIVPTLHETVTRHARERPCKVAVRFHDAMTYAELDALTDRVANGLRRDGVKPGDRIVFLGRNSDAMPVLALGANKVGVVPVPINWRLASAEMAALIRDCGARLIFAEPDFAAVVQDLDDIQILDARAMMTRGEWLAPAGSLADPVANPHAVAIQIYTSGTTGLPKGVMLTHRNLLGINLLRGELSWDSWSADDVTLISAPLGHIGAYGMLARSLFFGGEAVIQETFDAGETLDAIDNQGVSKVALVPTAIKMVLDHPRANEVDYSRIKTMIYGASPITANLLQRAVTTFGCDFAQSYGMTESSGPVVALPPADHSQDGTPKMAAAGLPLPASEIRIVGTDDVVLGPWQDGEICVRSIAVMKGYWNKPEETSAVLSPDGWLRTGDRGCLDEDGYLYIRGRVKEMIISGAENIYPAEVENAIATHPAVAEVAVVGIPDPHWGEAVTAFVVVKPECDLEPLAILEWARSQIARYKVPKSVQIMDSLPQNASGKIDKRSLRNDTETRQSR